jgi:hypothetical protein
MRMRMKMSHQWMMMVTTYLIIHLDNNDYDEDKEFVYITEDMFDPTHSALTYTADDDEEIIHVSVQHKFVGVHRSIGSLETFDSPNPEDEWENIMGEGVVMIIVPMNQLT